MIRILLTFLSGLLFIQGCAERVAILRGYDFTKIKKVAILDFSAADPVSGKIVADEFARHFLAKGIEVSDREVVKKFLAEESPEKDNYLKRIRDSFGIEAIVRGTVTEYAPDQNYLVFLGTQNSTGVNIINPITPIGGKSVYGQGTAFGLPNSQIITVNASIGVSVSLIDTLTAQVVWSNSYTYEGLDINTAVESLVTYLLKSLYPVWPVLKLND